jgi:hypothetical protein
VVTTKVPEPAQRLVELLETLPAGERQQIMAWLLGHGHTDPATAAALGWPTRTVEAQLHGLTSTLPAGEGSQLVTIRLPADRHAELRDWCGEHGFTMAAVVRGLVERFLEQQRPAL